MQEHGRRYTVDHMNKRSLEALVEVGKQWHRAYVLTRFLHVFIAKIGRSQIVSFMRANFIPLGIITNLLKDDLDGRSADLVVRILIGSSIILRVDCTIYQTALQAQNRSESMARSC